MLNMVIQINGKTRDVIKIKRDLPEDKVVEESKKSNKVDSILSKKKIKKIIFVQNRIVNFLID
jgi:leucyl-tRNA synthetase